MAATSRGREVAYLVLGLIVGHDGWGRRVHTCSTGTMRSHQSATRGSCVAIKTDAPRSGCEQQGEDLLGDDTVEGGGRLVGEHEVGFGHQGAGDGYPLTLPSRQV
jgi:hypothetical protein